MEKIIKVKDHIGELETIYEKDEFTLGEICDYIDSLNLLDEEAIEVIPCTRNEFAKGILATVRH